MTLTLDQLNRVQAEKYREYLELSGQKEHISYHVLDHGDYLYSIAIDINSSKRSVGRTQAIKGLLRLIRSTIDPFH